MKKRHMKQMLIALALAACTALTLPVTASATETTESGEEYDRNASYTGEIVTGTGEKGNNHTASVILVDETGDYPGGGIIIKFEDVTGVHTRRILFQEAYYRKGMTYDVYLVAPGTFNVSSNVAEGYTIVDTLSGEEFTSYAAYGESAIVLLSIRSDEDGETAQGSGSTEGAEQSAILSGNVPGETDNPEAQEMYQELLDTISFIADDPTWEQILTVKGNMSQRTYDATIPDSEERIPLEELSSFDKLVYCYTYCCFATLKNGSNDNWNTHTSSRDALVDYCCKDFLNFKPTEGNEREKVNEAFEKIWDWQYEYIKEHNEPYNFVQNCSYSAMGFGVTGSGTETEKPTDDLGLTEDDKKEILEAIGENDVPEAGGEKSPWEETMEVLSHSLLSIGILVSALIALGVVLIIKKRKNVDEDTEE